MGVRKPIAMPKQPEKMDEIISKAMLLLPVSVAKKLTTLNKKYLTKNNLPMLAITT